MSGRVFAIAGALVVLLGVGLAGVLADGFTRLTKIITLIGLALLLVSFIVAFSQIVNTLRTRQGRFGLNVLFGSIAFLGIIVVVNFLSARYFARADLTANARFSLAPQTERVIDRLIEPATFYTFFDRQDPSVGRAFDLLREYDFASDKINVVHVQRDKEPGLVERLNVLDLDTWLVIEIGEQRESLLRLELQEETVTNALLRTIEPDRRKALFLQGHGEREHRDPDAAIGYSAVTKLLEDENFDVESFSFFESASLPDDADVLIVAGIQKRALTAAEAREIGRWLDAGNDALFLIDPVRNDERTGFRDLGVDSLLASFGVELGSGVVYDNSPVARQRNLGQFRPIANQYRAHPITVGFSTQDFTVLSQARTVRRRVSRGTGVEFLNSNQRSWEEMDAYAEGPVTMNEGRDVVGPVPIGVAVSVPIEAWRPDPSALADPDRRRPRPETRVVVVGDTDVFANSLMQSSAIKNRVLFANIMNWLAEQDDLIAVRAVNPDDRQLRLGASDRNLIRILALVVYPLLMLVAGFWTWARRRRKDT